MTGMPFEKKYNIKLPKSRHEVEEFGPGKKGIILCPECNSSYFKKSWHHDFKGLKFPVNQNLPITFKLCPACQMIKNKQYEGRITLKNVPAKYAEELENFIIAYGKRATDRDPMDRIIGVKKNGSTWVVTTTENQLANKLAKKIQSSFKKVKAKTKFNREPSDVAHITVEFQK